MMLGPQPETEESRKASQGNRNTTSLLLEPSLHCSSARLFSHEGEARSFLSRESTALST